MKQLTLRACALALSTGVLVGSLSACSPAHGPDARAAATAPRSIPLRDDRGHDETLGALAARAKLTVLLFFSADCPVQKAHDAQIRQLVTTYAPQGVQFTAVVSERDADMATTRATARERGLEFPVLEDRGARLADALGVEYSTHTVVLDPEGRVLYSGAIDSDRTHPSASAARWLERALEAAVAGHPVDKPSTEPLGCLLQKR